MQPNDLPQACWPMELSDEPAAWLIEFLYEFTEALERRYAGQLLRSAHRHDLTSSPPDTEATVDGCFGVGVSTPSLSTVGRTETDKRRQHRGEETRDLLAMARLSCELSARVLVTRRGL
jgi:hypothetical protein